VKLVKAESSRVGRTFMHLAKKWRSLGNGIDKRVDDPILRGVRASCLRQEAGFLRLATLANTQHAELLKCERYYL